MNISSLLYAASRAGLKQTRKDIILYNKRWEPIAFDPLGAMAYCLDQSEALNILPNPTYYVDFIHDLTGRTGLLKVRPYPLTGQRIYVYRIVHRMNQRRISFREIADWLHSEHI